MPNFGIIGNMLKSKYISAVEVKRKRRNSKKVFVSINPNRKTVTSDLLLILAMVVSVLPLKLSGCPFGILS
jgi:hypothetical protein